MKVITHHAGNKRRLLEERVKALEAKPTMRYYGVWKGDVAYEVAWVARSANTSTKPSTTGDWQLAVKRGHDGKDGRSAPGARGNDNF